VAFRRFREYNPYSVVILTWGGLRGGLALAMAMAIPAGVMIIPSKQIDVREIILVMTYSAVFFSILVQGSSITPLINKAKAWQEKQK
jgi:CPA1 family monovalent cation:H+ antiporter